MPGLAAPCNRLELSLEQFAAFRPRELSRRELPLEQFVIQRLRPLRQLTLERRSSHALFALSLHTRLPAAIAIEAGRALALHSHGIQRFCLFLRRSVRIDISVSVLYARFVMSPLRGEFHKLFRQGEALSLIEKTASWDALEQARVCLRKLRKDPNRGGS